METENNSGSLDNSESLSNTCVLPSENDSTDSVSDHPKSEDMITEDLNEDNSENSDNSLNKSKTIPCQIVPNTNNISQNILSNDMILIDNAKTGSSLEANLKNINPTPNVEDMVTDELTNCDSVESTSKCTSDVESTESNSSSGDDSGKLEHCSENINTVIDVSLSTEGERNCDTVDAMNKDQKWKTDSVYQKDLSSLKLLCDYGTDSDDDNSLEDKLKSKTIVEQKEAPNIDEVKVISTISTRQGFRNSDSEESDTEEEDSKDDSSEEEESSTSSSEETSSSDDSENSSSNECVIIDEKKRQAEVPKTKGELGLDDLPPIEDLHISVPEYMSVEIGKVLSIVDTLVVVQSIKGCPTLDLDSVLFLDNGHSTLGHVFDVFGKVGEACYCVRFNSKEHALKKGVEPGMPVYYAPQTEHSKFVFLADLMKMKGSDASWVHNNEPPEKFLDYSDDEEERRAKKGDKPTCREVAPEESRTRPKRTRGGPWGASPANAPSAPEPRAPGPRPLLRPAAFQPQPQPPSTQRLYRNPSVSSAPPTPPHPPAPPSPWAVPPPVLRYSNPAPSPPPHARPLAPNLFSSPPPARFSFGNRPPAPAAFGAPPFTAPSAAFANPGAFGRPPPFGPHGEPSPNGPHRPQGQRAPYDIQGQYRPQGSHDQYSPYGPQGQQSPYGMAQQSAGQHGPQGQHGFQGQHGSQGFHEPFPSSRTPPMDFASLTTNFNGSNPGYSRHNVNNNTGQFGLQQQQQPMFQNHAANRPQGWMG